MQELDTIVWSGNHCELAIDAQDADAILQPGKADDTVRAISEKPYIREQIAKLHADDIRAEVKESGAWDSEELSDDDANVQRLIWIFGCNIAETELCDCGERPDGERVAHSPCYTECDGCNKSIPYNLEYCGDCEAKYRD